MNYKETLQAIDPMRAFKTLNISADQQGSYIYYPCTSCGRRAVIKAYGDKKNVWYCPECKDKGHIISLVLSVMNDTDSEPWNYEKAKRFLVEKATGYSPKTIKKELSFNYELGYDPFLEERGISKEICEKLQIGRPKGKTMLSGCIAFTVSDGTGKKIAYYGIRIKDQRPVFHKSFNPELYLYNFDKVNPEEEVHFTTDIFECVRMIEQRTSTVCNFALPYLSTTQLEMLQKYKQLSVKCENEKIDEIKKQLFENFPNYIRFIKPTLKSPLP